MSHPLRRCKPGRDSAQPGPLQDSGIPSSGWPSGCVYEERAAAAFSQLWFLPALSIWGPTWFSVAGWHSSNRIPNALGVAFLFFLIMLIPQGVLGAATLSSGMDSGKESRGQLEKARRVPHIQCHTHTLGHRDFIKELGRLKITCGERRLRGQGACPQEGGHGSIKVVGGLKDQPVR